MSHVRHPLHAIVNAAFLALCKMAETACAVPTLLRAEQLQDNKNQVCMVIMVNVGGCLPKLGTFVHKNM